MEQRVKAFPVLEGKIAERGIMKKAIAARLGLSYRAFMNRMEGICDFEWHEVCILQSTFFPDMSKDDLMRTNRQ